MKGTGRMTDQPGPLHGFHHLALAVRDFDASVRFYTDALGFTPALAWGEGDARGIMLDAGNDNYIELFAGGPAEEKPEGVLLHFALRTDNCDAALQRAMDAGAVVTMPPTAVDIPATTGPTPVRIAFCKGLDGEIIEFFQSAAI